MINELDFLRQLLPELHSSSAGLRIGPGDDCAAVVPTPGQETLAAADQLIAGIHFTYDTPPQLAGAKLMNRNLSDIAAMGGRPRWALLTIAANGWSSDWLLEFCRGVIAAGRRYDTELIGGDLAALPETGMAASLSIIGEAPSGQAVRRYGARPGDGLYVTGRIGNSFSSGRHLTFTPRLREGSRLRYCASAMLDISDGLLLDARRLAAASGVNLAIDLNSIPLHDDAVAPAAWSDGEDYELLFTAPGNPASHWPADLAPITKIGCVTTGCGILTDLNGNPLIMEKSGYEH